MGGGSESPVSSPEISSKTWVSDSQPTGVQNPAAGISSSAGS